MGITWPWNSKGGRIQDIPPHELANLATKNLQHSGRTALSGRMIYRTLEVDPYQPQALLMLSEMFRGKPNGARPKGDEIFAGIILEFAMDRKSGIPPDAKRFIDAARIEVLNSWGFVTERAGELDIDHIGYMTYINELMGQVRSVANGFQMAMAKLGVQSGVLDPTTGKHTQLYKDWLKSDARSIQH
jgi:hypothetical protein